MRRVLNWTRNNFGSEGETLSPSTMAESYNIHPSAVMSKAKTNNRMSEAFRIGWWKPTLLHNGGRKNDKASDLKPISRRGKTHTSERKSNVKSQAHPQRQRPNTNIVRNGGEKHEKLNRHWGQKRLSIRNGGAKKGQIPPMQHQKLFAMAGKGKGNISATAEKLINNFRFRVAS